MKACVLYLKKTGATEIGAQDFLEMEEDANNEEEMQQLDDEFDDNIESSEIPRSRSSMPQEVTSKGKKKKSQVDPFIEVFQDAVKFLGEGLENMSKMGKGVEQEEEFDKKRLMITMEISNIRSLTRIEKFKACEKLRDDVEKMKFFFWDLEDAEREDYTRNVGDFVKLVTMWKTQRRSGSSSHV